MGRSPREDRGRDWSEASLSPGTSEWLPSTRGKEEAREESSSRASRGSTTLLTAWFQTGSLQSWERINSCRFNRPRWWHSDVTAPGKTEKAKSVTGERTEVSRWACGLSSKCATILLRSWVSCSYSRNNQVAPGWALG